MKIVSIWLLVMYIVIQYNLTVISHGSSVNGTLCIAEERDALLQFKHGILYDECGLLTSWVHDTDCCLWHGVHCNPLTGHVVELHVHSDDADCALGGKVSPSLGELKHLKLLNLHNNDFDGKIPHELGNLSKLTTLDIGRAFPGASEGSLHWISRLKLLKHLDLSYVDLSKATNWTRIVNDFKFLSVVSLDWCHLPMKISSSFTYINSSDSLRSISLLGNYLNDSSIFLWLFSMPKITTIDLSFNEFQGPVPSEFDSMHSLTYLDLSNNHFQGSFPKVIVKLCNLKHLYLGANSFTDEITIVIHALLTSCESRTLLTLDLSQNMFWGAIPDNISSLHFLRELNLEGNWLNGEISIGIGQLSMLEMLDLSSNNLNGTLTPTHFLNLSRLRRLYLSNNAGLIMKMDLSWDPPFQLEEIGLGSCKLGPLFPKWIQTQTNISFLDISSAQITDIIPNSFCNSISFDLFNLNMSFNQFYGILPNLLERTKRTHWGAKIDLRSNLFEGVIPSGFAKASLLYLSNNKFSNSSSILCPRNKNESRSLWELDLSNNMLSGKLPDCWMNFDFLRTLHLEDNEFSGNIPESLGNSTSLQYLLLNNNSLSGSIPISFKNCSSLVALNIGNNSLSGYIPPWIGNAFQSMGALLLDRNNFIGEIPTSVCQMGKLQILDLAFNNISGVIPNCISNFTAMLTADARGGLSDYVDYVYTDGYDMQPRDDFMDVSWKREEQRFKYTVEFVKYIDLAGNKLSGDIPSGISMLTGLFSLDLSSNELNGSIPSKIGELTSLELLDLSDNHLTGNIPVSLAQVTSLGILNLSNNYLSGMIPVSTQLQSFEESSYTGNLGLCGAPLPMCSADQSPSHAGNGITSPTEHDENGVSWGLYISMVLGVIVGFWGVFGTLVISTSWRHAYFRVLYEIRDKIYEITMLTIAKVCRKPRLSQ